MAFSSPPVAALHWALKDGVLDTTLAIDDGAAVLFAGADISRVINRRLGAAAYRITATAGQVTEVPLATEAIA